MSSAFSKKDFFSKIVQPREKLKNYDENTKDIINSKKIGPKSKELVLKTNKYESSGGAGFALFEVPPIMVKGKNDLLYDADGKEYVDCSGGFAASTVGHCHPEVVKRINEQSKELIHNFDLPTIPRIELAEKLAKKNEK